MDTVREVWSFITEDIWVHWVGIAYTLLVVVVAQLLKSRLLTAELASRSRIVFWLRRTFQLALILVSILLGTFCGGELAPGVDGAGSRALYLGGCACAAIVGFDIVKQFIKKKYDVQIDI